MNKNSRIITVGSVFLLMIITTYKYAQALDTLWKKTCDIQDYDFGFSVQRTLDAGYIFTGYTF